MAKASLAIPASFTSSERMWSCSGKILSARTARLKTNIMLATIFVAENAKVQRKDYEEIVKRVNNPTSLYLPEAGTQASVVGTDVGQDLFSLKYVFEIC